MNTGNKKTLIEMRVKDFKTFNKVLTVLSTNIQLYLRTRKLTPSTYQQLAFNW